jgi:predicted RNA-binding Zn ribbon-like protein
VDDSYQFEFVGGAPCLDLVNTVGGRRSPSADEHLNEYADLVDWARQGQLLSEPQARRLRQHAEEHPQLARRTLADAINLREAIARIFAALAGGNPPAPADLERLNAALPRAMAHLQIAKDDHGYEWRWASDEDALDCMLWPAVRSAAELLLGAGNRLGICEAPTCGWLFVDTSRNHSRRWCVMEDCGNRAKARRHYKKRKKNL